MNISNYNLDGNDISNSLDDKLNPSNYTETFQTYLEGNDTEGLEDNLDDNFKEELEVLNNDLSEAIKFEETNNITNINTPEESFQKYNVIPNSGLESQLINKPYNVVLYKDVTGTHTFTLNETIKNSWPKPKMMIFNFPSNPTTQCVDLGFLESLVEIALKNDIFTR